MSDDYDHWFSPDPPTPEEEKRDHDAFEITKLFDQAGRGEEVAWCLSTAFSKITGCRYMRTGPGITQLQRDRMLDALGNAYRGAWAALPFSFDRQRLMAGVIAAGEIIKFWGSSDLRRAAGGEFISDMLDYARMFQNSMHNQCLQELISERAARRMQRRAAILGELRTIQNQGAQLSSVEGR